MPQQFVVMSGYPASGKSTLAVALAAELGFARLSKDAILLTLYDAFGFGPGDAAASLRTGAAAWSVFWMQARACPNVVLDTNIKPGSAYEMDQLRSLGGAVVEVRCECSPELARARYQQRAAAFGHAALRDNDITPERQAAYERPIGLGRLLTVDSTRPIDAVSLAGRVRALLAEVFDPA